MPVCVFGGGGENKLVILFPGCKQGRGEKLPFLKVVFSSILVFSHALCTYTEQSKVTAMKHTSGRGSERKNLERNSTRQIHWCTYVWSFLDNL